MRLAFVLAIALIGCSSSHGGDPESIGDEGDPSSASNRSSNGAKGSDHSDGVGSLRGERDAGSAEPDEESAGSGAEAPTTQERDAAIDAPIGTDDVAGASTMPMCPDSEDGKTSFVCFAGSCTKCPAATIDAGSGVAGTASAGSGGAGGSGAASGSSGVAGSAEPAERVLWSYETTEQHKWLNHAYKPGERAFFTLTFGACSHAYVGSDAPVQIDEQRSDIFPAGDRLVAALLTCARGIDGTTIGDGKTLVDCFVLGPNDAFVAGYGSSSLSWDPPTSAVSVAKANSVTAIKREVLKYSDIEKNGGSDVRATVRWSLIGY